MSRFVKDDGDLRNYHSSSILGILTSVYRGIEIKDRNIL